MNVLKNKVSELEIPLEVLAGLTGVPASSLSMATRGTKDLPNDRFRAVDALLTELAQLVEFHAPVPIAWKNVAVIRDLLEEMRRKKKHPGLDPWALLQEIAASDAAAICTKYHWTPADLIEQLKTAHERLHELTVSLTAGTTDRAQLHTV